MKHKERQCPDYILCLSKNHTEELCDITLKHDAKFEKELACALKNGMRNLVNFDRTFESLKTCTLMALFDQSI